MELTDEELQDLYTWVDEIPLSRPKRNIARDFSDGVLAAEVVFHFYPKAVQLHNYSAANGFTQKMYNWNTLNAKVLSKLGFQLAKNDIEGVSRSAPLAAECVLNCLRLKLGDAAKGGATTRDDGEYANQFSSAREAGSPTPPAAAPKMGSRTAPQAGAMPSEQAVSDQLTIRELREMNEILETKTRKLEQLVRLKDAKIQTLLLKLEAIEHA